MFLINLIFCKTLHQILESLWGKCVWNGVLKTCGTLYAEQTIPIVGNTNGFVRVDPRPDREAELHPRQVEMNSSLTVSVKPGPPPPAGRNKVSLFSPVR